MQSNRIVRLVLVLVLAAMAVAPLNAQSVSRQLVPADGTRTTVRLQPGATYFFEVRGWAIYGQPNAARRRQLQNDACYEFNESNPPKSLPVFNNSLKVALCDGQYRPSHVYRSAQFVASGNSIDFWMFDTDYRDNSGYLEIEVYKK